MKVEKNQIVGIAATLAVHALVVLLLVLLRLNVPLQEPESGIPVALGDVAQAQGYTEPYQFTEVSSVKSDVPSLDPVPQAQPQPQVNEPLVTQPDEPTIDMPTAEEVEAKKRAEAERQAAERAAQQMASAFGKGFEMGSKGEATAEPEEKGVQGSETGVSASDQVVGTSSAPSLDLAGRSTYDGGRLPSPANTAQEGGNVVVKITVNPEGRVIATSIDLRRTDTSNPQLRKAAEEAAKRARFNSIDAIDNQIGTITYKFTVK